MMPGVAAALGDEIDTLGWVADAKIISLIKAERNPLAEKMVSNWNFPPFTSGRAKALGFNCKESFDEIIQVHIQDELNGKISGYEK